jgi:Domain of unknown function (DUF5753)/Helix-turn-helix domain
MARTYTTVRQRRLGLELRKLREQAGISLEGAAEVLECNKAKISRIETGQNGIRPYELRGLLKTYGVSDQKLADALVEMAKEGSKRGWWNRYAGVLSGIGDLAQLEAAAVSLRTWQTTLIPGLLQTPDYMRALFKHGRFSDQGAGIGKSVEARTARQAVLTKEGAPEFWAVLYEPVFRALVGGARVMRGQLGHLIDFIEEDRITVQVMPYTAMAHSGLDGPFYAVGMPVPGMDVVLIDNVASPVYLEEDDDVQRFRTLFDALRAAALGPVPSLDLIKQAAAEL